MDTLCCPHQDQPQTNFSCNQSEGAHARTGRTPTSTDDKHAHRHTHIWTRWLEEIGGGFGRKTLQKSSQNDVQQGHALRLCRGLRKVRPLRDGHILRDSSSETDPSNHQQSPECVHNKYRLRGVEQSKVYLRRGHVSFALEKRSSHAAATVSAPGVQHPLEPTHTFNFRRAHPGSKKKGKKWKNDSI